MRDRRKGHLGFIGNLASGSSHLDPISRLCAYELSLSLMSYRDLEIWKLACQAATAVHRMTIHELPNFEMYEEGSQIRRSVKSIRSNIVAGYGRRRYKQEFIRFLVFAHASCDETIDHLEGLFETQSLRDETIYRDLSAQLDLLGRKLNSFIETVEREHRTEAQPATLIRQPASRIPQ